MTFQMLVSSLALAGLVFAVKSSDFGFDWQQRVFGLGLDETNTTAGGCAQACQWLQQIIPEQEILPSSIAYFKEKSFYWSVQQAELSPQCFVLPNNAEDVAAILHLAKQAECPFAVKSGGHGAFPGASNIDGGITIDLQLLNEVTVSEDKTITRIGPGNRWVDVYSVLDAKNLSVVGGRVAEVGVGGLTLGGGISFFSGRYGWALDGVRNYQVVTATGEILNANLNSHPDLYWALRGGGNNFGIVTRFDMETFPQSAMWGGLIYNSFNTTSSLIEAFVQYAHEAPTDIDSHSYIFVVYIPEYKAFMAGAMLTYARPIENPAIFRKYLETDFFRRTLRITNVTDLTLELNQSNPNGLREHYSTSTSQISEQMAHVAVDTWVEAIESIKDVEGLLPALVLQIMPVSVISRFGKNGGNCLGVDVDEGPLLLTNYPVMWKHAEDDGRVKGAMKSAREKAVAWAKERDMHHRYLYQNYADISQDVFAGYGKENLGKLREVSKRYDLDQVFQRLQPGYFKLY